MTEFWYRELFSLGARTVTPGALITLVGYIAIVAIVAQLVRRSLVFRLLRRSKVDVGVQYATARIMAYAIWVIGALAILPWVGIDLKSVIVALGAVGVGIGLGLQNLADNFVSGLILLFERPVKVGDRVLLNDGVQGKIVQIHARATVVRTNESVDVLVPNAEFISQRVTNLSHQNRTIRFRFPIGVSYSSNVEDVREALLSVGRASPRLAEGEEPEVLFLGCGDSALNFVLRVPSDSMHHFPELFATEIYFAIWAEFATRGVEIPFPQRDLHLRSAAPLTIELAKPTDPSPRS